MARAAGQATRWQTELPPPGRLRVGWMDNLRVSVIAGVIVAHAATAYVVDVDWYYQERTTSTLAAELLSLPVLLGGLFGLGPLFLLAGSLAAGSLARKGTGAFVGGRLLRLGVPLLVFVGLIDPLTDYLGSRAEGEHPRLWPYLADQTGTRDVGPLWFVAALLVFSLAYAAWRRRRPARGGTAMDVRAGHLLGAVLAIAAASFVLRLGWPVGDDTFYSLQLPQWPQAAVLFSVGVLTGERGWLGRIPARWARCGGQLAAAGLVGLTVLAAAALAAGDLDLLVGGWHWQAVVFVTLEGLVAVAVSLWLIWWFRRRWDQQRRLAQRAGRGSYAAYVLHPPVLVVLSLLARPLPVPPEAKFVLVATTGVVVAFAVGVGLTRLRIVARIL